jgi:hypothetical protein
MPVFWTLYFEYMEINNIYSFWGRGRGGIVTIKELM